MWISVAVLIFALALYLLTSRKSFFYFFGALDITLRLINFIGLNIGVSTIAAFIKENIPGSIGAIINMYSTGILNTILMWIYVICYIIFDIIIIKLIFKKR